MSPQTFPFVATTDWGKALPWYKIMRLVQLQLKFRFRTNCCHSTRLSATPGLIPSPPLHGTESVQKESMLECMSLTGIWLGFSKGMMVVPPSPSDGSTCLHHAAYSGSVEMLALLLSLGADGLRKVRSTVAAVLLWHIHSPKHFIWASWPNQRASFSNWAGSARNNC